MTRDCGEITLKRGTRLHAAAIAYVAGRLEEAWLFRRDLLDRFLTRGEEITSCVQGSIADLGSADFVEGGVTSAEASARWLTGKLLGYLKQGPTNIVCVENAVARRGHAYLSSRRSAVLYYDDHVIHVLGADESESDIGIAIAESESTLGIVGVMSVWGDVKGLKDRGVIGAAQLEEIALNTAAVIVTAYDGEGYLIVR